MRKDRAVEELKATENDLAEAEAKLREFEDTNFDERGNIMTPLDGAC
ncbi:MAG: hypothetical protein LBB59_00840 [Campylobacteraceae bacterium]|jgi:hypothetical protein|nr:hypothetical protein [Campylobacteraceae bacterium]